MRTNHWLLAVSVAMQAILPATAQSQSLDMGVNPANFSVVIWMETNAFRRSSNELPLQRDFSLGKAAQGYANYLARTNTMGHNADGRDPFIRITAAGFQPCHWSENVYEQWALPGPVAWREVAAAAMSSWKSSPVHAANMRAAKATQLGVGVAAWKHGDRSYYKVVQVFGDDCQSSDGTKSLGKKP